MAPHSSTLAWKIPWTEEPGRLQSMGSLRVGHDWATSLLLFTFLHWRRKWQPTPVFLPGESQARAHQELGGLPSMGSHRVGHDWSDLAAYKLNCLLVFFFFFFFKCFMDKLRSVLKLQHRSPVSQSGTLLTSPRGFRCSMKLTVHKYEHFVSLYKTYEMYKTSDTKRLYKTSKHLIQKDCNRWLGFKDRDYPLELSFLILKYSTSHILIISVEPNELTYIA